MIVALKTKTKKATTRKKPLFTKAQRALWLQIKEYLLEEPKRLNMAVPLKRYYEQTVKEDRDLPPCGTVGCVAGTAVWIDALKKHKPLHFVPNYQSNVCKDFMPWDECREKAIKLLGLTSRNADKVFQVDRTYDLGMALPCWRADFRDRFRKAVTPRGRVRVVADMIDHILEYGVDW